MDLNTCLETTKDYHAIAFYSHLIPVFITIIVSIFVLLKSRFSLLSKIFTCFTVSFCLWLIGDVIAWTTRDYNLVSFVWAPLDYINIIFYLFGAYFFIVLLRGKDISFWTKIIILILALPAWWLTLANESINVLNQPVCEAFNNDFLSKYKLAVEIFVMVFIILYALIFWLKNSQQRLQIIIVSTALILFFGVFSITEYISSETGIYEINLYSLFVLPVFLFMVVYSIANLEIFKIRLIGSQLLAYVLVIMVGSQFFFLENTTYKTLTIVTFLLSLGFGVLLVRSGKREEAAREKIEKLAVELESANIQLKELDRQKDELLSIVSHQLATPVSSVKGYVEMFLDGDMGELREEQKEHFHILERVSSELADLVSMILDVARIQLGRVKIEPQELDLNEFFKDLVDLITPKAKEKNINFLPSIPKNLPKALLDKRYTKMTVENLLSNAVKYTPDKGNVKLTVETKNNILRCVVEDTGCGIPKADQDKIFGKLFRASNVRNTVDGNGFGLYVAKGAIEAQGGKIWFESDEGKGTKFFIELPLKQ